MTRLLLDKRATPERNDADTEGRSFFASRGVAQFAAIFIVLVIYCYPSLKAAADFGEGSLPPIFAPDLTLYLNLSSVKTADPGKILNSYYLVPVPANGTAYLKFRLGPALFSIFNELFQGRMWLAMFVWNVFWWALLCRVSLWLFDHSLPVPSLWLGIAGLGLLMLVNIGMLRPLLAAWIHLPALAGFQHVALPFMRAFSPQIPMPLLLAYLGLQIRALRTKVFYPWVGMAALQLLALSAFPYATLMMAGLTFLGLSWQVVSKGVRSTWRTVFVYGAACAVADATFLMRGSLNIYSSHSSPIHFQPQLLPHLVGGTWLLLCLLTIATVFSKTLPPEVKWPLAGLGATNALLMLGDAVVPATVLLLSAHASYFAHTTAVVLLVFLTSAALVRMHHGSKTHIAVAVALCILALNGILLSLGTYRAFLPENREQVEVAHLLSSLKPAEGDLLLAASRTVDDACGWSALLSKGPVLFCTDAEIMLTPQQNRTIHRFRQALYLYFSGRDSRYLQRLITSPNPTGLYELGYWAEATSFSPEEQKEGLRDVQADLIPNLELVENHDASVSNFLHHFNRIVVLDNLQEPTFPRDRLSSFLRLESEQHVDHWALLSYVPQ